MKKFLCYDTNDAVSGRVNVDSRGMLRPNATVPSTNGTSYQQLVTDGSGNTKWEDRLAYEGSRVVVDAGEGIQLVKVANEIPSWASINVSMKLWLSRTGPLMVDSTDYLDLGNGSFAAALAFFIATDNVEFSGVVFPKKGVYVRNPVPSSLGGTEYVIGISTKDSNTPEITWDGNIEITKKIDEKFLPDQLILYAPEIGDGTGSTQVYKNEDVSNLEYASVEEVQRAFFGRGVFIKMAGTYVRASAFVPASEMLDNKFFFGVPM